MISIASSPWKNSVGQADLRFALPPSLGKERALARGERLRAALENAVGAPVEIAVSPSYDALARDLLSGEIDAAWAPPYVCARIEAMGARVLLRGVRRGSSSYRAALLKKRGSPVSMEDLSGTTVAWTDQDSTGGYLLPLAYLKSQGIDAGRTFYKQLFTGSYRAAVEAVLDGRADITSIFAQGAVIGAEPSTGLDEVIPESKSELEVLALTDESPNDGVAVSMQLPSGRAHMVEQALLSLHETDEGYRLFKDVFNIERFEPAPRLGYRALYRVALSSL